MPDDAARQLRDATLAPPRDVADQLSDYVDSSEASWLQRMFGAGGGDTAAGSGVTGDFLPRIDHAGGSRQISEFEDQALGPINDGLLNAEPATLGQATGGILHTMSSVQTAVSELESTLAQASERIAKIYSGHDDQTIARSWQMRKSQIDALADYAAPIVNLADTLARAGDGYNSVVSSIGAVCADARVQIQNFVDSDEAADAGSTARPFHFRTDVADAADAVVDIVDTLPDTSREQFAAGDLDASAARDLALRFINDNIDYVWGGGHAETPGPSRGTLAGDVNGQAEFYGDHTKTGLDCSGLVREYVYRSTGQDLADGDTREQFARGSLVDAGDARPGDVYFPPVDRDTDPQVGNPTMEHVQVYLGDTVLEAPQSGGVVRETDFIPGGAFVRFGQ